MSRLMRCLVVALALVVAACVPSTTGATQTIDAGQQKFIPGPDGSAHACILHADVNPTSTSGWSVDVYVTNAPDNAGPCAAFYPKRSSTIECEVRHGPSGALVGRYTDAATCANPGGGSIFIATFIRGTGTVSG